MAASAYARRVSFNERLYLAAERRQPGFCIQLVLEMEGELSAERLEAAVAQASAHNPGARLLLRGALGWTRWVAAGPTPPVRLLAGWAPDAPPPAEIARPLSAHQGPTCEVVLAPGPAPRLVLRCFHGVMDASGLLHFGAEIFRALRGEALLGAPCTKNDTELVTALAGRRRRPLPKDECPPLLGASGAQTRVVRWRRLRLKGPVPALVAKIAAVLAMDGPARVMIPVDLRNYQREPRSTGNRTCPLFIDVAPAQDWRAVHKILLQRLAKREPLRLDPAEDIAPWLPLWLLTALYAAWIDGHRRKGLFPFSALVTHLALPGADLLSAGDLRCRALYLLPPQSEFIPLCVSAVSAPAATDLVVSAPEDLVAEAQLDRLCDVLRSALA